MKWEADEQKYGQQGILFPSLQRVHGALQAEKYAMMQVVTPQGQPIQNGKKLI